MVFKAGDVAAAMSSGPDGNYIANIGVVSDVTVDEGIFHFDFRSIWIVFMLVSFKNMQNCQN